MSMMQLNETVAGAYDRSPVVRKILSEGGNAEACLTPLLNQIDTLSARIVQLEMICPRKVKTKDGKIFIWHCPYELIPVTESNL